jgi:hypothetical protein
VNFKTLGCAALLLALLPHAWASETRQEMLRSCVQQAKDQSLAGEAHAQFMRACLKKPEDAKPMAFASSEPQKLAPGPTVQPAMAQPAKPLKK